MWRDRMTSLAILVVLGAAASALGCGTGGAQGPAGERGPTGPSMPVIQSLAVSGLPAAPGARATVTASAQSAEGLALAYAWTASAGWAVEGSSTAAALTLVAPGSHGASGTASLTVTDARGRVATGVIALSTTGNGAPVISQVAGPAVLNRDVPTTLTVWAADPDGEPLTYAWTVPDGFELVSGGTTARAVVRATRFTGGIAEVAVSDGMAITTAGIYLSTADGSWGFAELIGSGGAAPATSPQVAMNRAGDAIAVWEQSDGVRRNAWGRRHVAGAGWGTAQLIEANDAGSVTSPQIAMDDAGNAIAVWQQVDGTWTSVWANRYEAGVGWGTARVLEPNDTGPADSPRIAMNAAGDGVAVWAQSSGGPYSVWTSRYAVATGWSDPVLLESTDTGSALGAQVAIDAPGNAIAVWSQSDGARDRIWANRLTVGAGWGAPELIEVDMGVAQSPQVTMDGRGNALAVWHQFDGAQTSIWSNRYTAGAGWGTASVIETHTVGFAADAQLAMNAAGEATVLWQLVSGNSLWTTRYTPGAGWEPASLFESSEPPVVPRVSMDDAGNAIAIWYQPDATPRNRVTTRRYVAGSGWGSATLITNNAGGTSALHPCIALNGRGDGIAAWEFFDGTRQTIWAETFR